MRRSPLSLRTNLLLALLAGLLAACSSGHVATAQDIDVHEALARQKGGAVLLDVRTPAEFQQGHAAGAQPVPWVDMSGRVNPDFFTEVAKLATPDKPVVVICRSGSRSASAARALRQHGYQSAVSVTGGSLEWQRDGLPWHAGQ